MDMKVVSFLAIRKKKYFSSTCLTNAYFVAVYFLLLFLPSETEHSDRRERPARDPQRGRSEQERTGGTGRVSAGMTSRREHGVSFT